jgi:3-phenylpropionate/cinnamic acid dioxygenase small subunit
MCASLREAVEDFLYHEAELLDERRFREWLDLFADDAVYWMPVRNNRLAGPDAVGAELAPPGGNAYFEDDKAALRLRVERLYTGSAWAETPPSRTRHLVTNVRVKRQERAELEVHSSFVVYRTRLEHDRDLYVGARVDRLRRVGDSFQIAHRTIILDQAILDAKNISTFL